MPTSRFRFLLLLPLLLVVSEGADVCPATDCNGSGVMEHHLGDVDNVAGSLVCYDSTRTYSQQNAYIRCFDGSVCDATRKIDAVSFHVRSLTVDNYAVMVNLYKGPTISCSDEGQVRGLHQTGLVASVTSAMMNSGTNFAVDVPMTENITLEPDESLLIEIHAPTLDNIGRFVIADSSDNDQCSPSYLQTESCGTTALPVNVALFRSAEGPGTTVFPGFPAVSFVISVRTSLDGTVSPKPTPSPEPSASPSTFSPQPSASPSTSSPEPSASPSISLAPVITTLAPTTPPPFDFGKCFVSVVAGVYCVLGIFFPSFRL